MEDKYYTPEIEEFHVGFEYEILQGGNYIKTNFLTSSQFGFDDVDDLINISKVKYLDKEDIESLGFKYIGNNLYEGIKNLMHVKFYNTNSPNYQWVIKHNYYGVLFKGKIKNKSELKRILKQLNI